MFYSKSICVLPFTFKFVIPMEFFSVQGLRWGSTFCWPNTIYRKYNHFPIALQWDLCHKSGVHMCVCSCLSTLSFTTTLRESLTRTTLQESAGVPSRVAQQRPGLRLAGHWEISVFGVNSVGCGVCRHIYMLYGFEQVGIACFR